ncbi:hypothetical protein BOSEA31B_15050 [Hyphomicrobiales bacterium]|nr:hypothetical protein BOSEA31B_15050 [Hyphomicrobiales bacterium]CAH1701538.1 hypothetical protein BOSEA1005_21237 [Hyphomicrobiales bacterium]CAI0345713.1 hypothetical protein BO1005MUT1_400009 [Hyphomicrobiales bacterium]
MFQNRHGGIRSLLFFSSAQADLTAPHFRPNPRRDGSLTGSKGNAVRTDFRPMPRLPPQL